MGHKLIRTANSFRIICLIAGALVASYSGYGMQNKDRPRSREAGVIVGVLPTGRLNAITDVAGVRVGHTTIVQGDDIRTGVTAVLPHAGNIFQEKVPGAVFIGNAFGKLAGSTQVNELGEIETPIVLTSTLSVPRVADAVLDFVLSTPGNEQVQSVNPLIAETNDGYLNDIRGRHIKADDVISAIKTAGAGVVPEGAVGAGTGTVAFGFKGGIGTSSRKLPVSLGGYTVGVLVQTNYGGVLTINGAPVGRELGRYFLKEELERSGGSTPKKETSQQGGAKGAASVAASSASETSLEDKADGSVIVVIATDAPVDSRNLKRLAARSMMGLGRTGSAASNGSGDYAIAFSTATELRIKPLQRNSQGLMESRVLSNDAMSPLFLAAIEATEEAVYNSLFKASTTSGRGRTVEALPIENTLKILRTYGAIK